MEPLPCFGCPMPYRFTSWAATRSPGGALPGPELAGTTRRRSGGGIGRVWPTPEAIAASAPARRSARSADGITRTL